MSTGAPTRHQTRPAAGPVRPPHQPAASRRSDPGPRRPWWRRWRAGWRRVLGALLLIGALTGAAAIIWFSPVLAVHDVEVDITATNGAAGGVSTAQVRDAIGDLRGIPLVRVDTATIAARLEALPAVASAEVIRAWPQTLAVRVTPRTAVAVARADGGGFDLVDIADVRFAQVSAAQRPPGLPLLGQVAPGAETAVLAVAASLPASLRADIVTIGATSPDGVRFGLRSIAVSNGAAGSTGKGTDRTTTIRWGSPERPEDKLGVLAALRKPGVDLIDVSAPDTPTARRR